MTFRSMIIFLAAAGIAALPGLIAIAGRAAAPAPVDAARFDGDAMRLPDDLDQWVFLGATMGQGYNPAVFDPNSPGLFQVVSMEPAAYQRFMETGNFPDGSMFSLAFYSVETGNAAEDAGFTMGELRLTEIHYKDAARFPESGFNFYMFPPGETRAGPLGLPNDCVECHTADGGHDSVFTQFYPVIRERLARDAKMGDAAADP